MSQMFQRDRRTGGLSLSPSVTSQQKQSRFPSPHVRAQGGAGRHRLQPLDPDLPGWPVSG